MSLLAVLTGPKENPLPEEPLWILQIRQDLYRARQTGEIPGLISVQDGSNGRQMTLLRFQSEEVHDAFRNRGIAFCVFGRFLHLP